MTRTPGPLDFAGLIAEHAGERPSLVPVGRDDVACLVYTSGTTGPPKGAMNTHRNVAFTLGACGATGPGSGDGDVNLALAPLFHITGLIAGLGTSLAGALPLVLGYRFDPAATLRADRAPPSRRSRSRRSRPTRR